MVLLKWDVEKYGVGVNKFNQHHEQLVEMINELHDAMKSGEGKDKLVEIVEGMKNYTQYHFDAEEKLMKKYGYELLGKHQTQHNNFVDKVSEFEDELRSGKVTLTMDVMNFLKDWLTSHIMKSDQEYREFFNNNGIN